MKTDFTTQKPDQTGSALMLVMIMSAVALAILAGVMTWAATSNRLTHRSIQYTQSNAAAEAATEKVVSQLSQDFLSGGESLVVNNLNSYRQNTVPTSSDSAYWSTWQFNDANGNIGQTFVQRTPGTNFMVLDSTYAGLQGYVSTYTVVSHARDTASVQDVTGGVLQELRLTGIPIFQFYLFSSGNMEISCGQPFVGTGRVFSDGHLYIEPDNLMTFESSVSAVLDVLYQRDTADGDTRGAPAGLPATFQPGQPTFPHTALTLPIGTANTPIAIREIIEPTPPGEDPNLPISKLRYNNLCDMVLTVSNSGVSATSGAFNHFLTPIPTNELALFVSTNNSFVDNREGKTVQPIDLDIGNLAAWSGTNTSLRYSISASNLIMSSIYVVDARTPPVLPAGNLGAVRVFDGTILPQNGLTVATGRPLYVKGDYNELNSANLGTHDTSATRPASLVADAITFLSDNWSDSAAGPGTTPPNAANTTVNAALLTGVVETTLGHYSGGMENFPRFLETWGLTNTNTYNGSMMKMFPSQYATGVWGQDNVYDPPARNWAYDTNFDNPIKLPPLTPSFQDVKRSQWVTVAPGSNVAPTTP